MATRNHILSCVAEGDIQPYRILKHGSKDNHVKQATGANDALIGVSDECVLSDGDHADVSILGCVPVEYGGTIKRGDFITADAQGRAVKATAKHYIGQARVSGVKDDIGEIIPSRGFL